MAVREIDARTASDADLLAIHAIEKACLPELIPGEPSRSAEEAVAYYRHPPSNLTRYTWAWDDRGAANLGLHGPGAVFGEVLVDPSARRRGIGRALLVALLARARELGLKQVHGHHATPAGAAFCARAGAVDGQRDVRSLLRLADASLPEPELPDGWSLVSWTRRAPDELVESFARARAALDDAPTPDGMQFPVETAESIRDLEAALERRGREGRVTVAVDPAGEVGAFTEVRVTPGSALAFTEDTATVAVHRGQGLATAVKLESLRRLRSDHPEVEVLTTMNAEDNRVMRRVNEKIGFTPAATLTTATITL
jgi:GNAT superfamily N-acetyltransferase